MLKKNTPKIFDRAARSASEKQVSNSAWRAQVLVDVHDLRTQLRWLRTPQGGRDDLPTDIAAAYADAAEEMLKRAHETAVDTASPRGVVSGAHIQTASRYLQSARINLIRLSPFEHLASQLPDIEVEARAHLAASDPRLTSLRELSSRAEHGNPNNLSRRDRSFIISTVQGLDRETQREQSRVRSFRNVIVGVSLALTMLVLALVLVGWFSPSTLPMCFVPDTSSVACPTSDSEVRTSTEGDAINVSGAERSAAQPWDITVIAFVGLLGATLAAATGLRTIRGSSDPFSLPVALALLKLPTGAFTAVLGLLLIRAGFVPGLSALDTSAQIIAYGILLGYSQQLFTGFVDRQANTVLAEAGSTTAPPPSQDAVTARNG